MTIGNVKAIILLLGFLFWHGRAAAAAAPTPLLRSQALSTTNEDRRLQGVLEPHFDFKYGFFVNLTSIPSDEDFYGMICETQKKITLEVTVEFGNECLELYMTDISWSFINDGNFQVALDFYLNGRSRDGGVVPSYSEILDLWELHFVPEDYISKYLWFSVPLNQNIFFETEEVYFTADSRGRVAGTIPKIDWECPDNPIPVCPTPAPTLSTLPTESPTTLEPTTVSPTVFPTNDPTGGPTADPTFSPSSLPTSPPTAAPTFLSVDTVKSMFILNFAFLEGLGREPTDEEVQSVLCLTDVYFFNLFRRIFKDNHMTYDSVNVNWTWNETAQLPLTIIMGANVTYGDGSKPPVEDIIELFDESKDLDVYVDDYVYDVPETDSVFLGTDYVEFEGVARAVPVDAKIRSVEEFCGQVTASPAPTPSPFNRLGGVILPGDFGLSGQEPAPIDLDIVFPDEIDRNRNYDLTDEEVEGLGCEINRYLRDILSPYTNSTELSINTVDVDWSYTPGADEPVEVSFSVSSIATEDGLSWPSPTQIMEIWTNHFDANVFISEYVTQSEPQGTSLFASAEDSSYSVDSNGVGTTNRITTTEECAETTHTPLARFQLDFSFVDIADLRRLEESVTTARAPTEDEVQGLACQTNLYFKELLEEALPGQYFSIEVVGVDWVWDGNFDYPLRVIFHTQSTDIDGMPFPSNFFIYDTFQTAFNKDRYIQQYVWKSEPQRESIFFQTTDVNWEASIRSQGVSRLPTGVCPAATQAPLPTLGVRFGFFDGETGDSSARSPTVVEIEGLMCETNDYIESILATEYPDETFSVSTVGIDWTYTEADDLPVGVTFSTETRLQDGTLFPSADELVDLLNRTFDVDTYIRDYVWKSEPLDESVFYETETISWDIEERTPDEHATLSEATCTEPTTDDGGDPVRKGDDDFMNGDDGSTGLGDDDADGVDRAKPEFDWWHWLLIVGYLICVICLICTLIQCYYCLLPEEGELELMDEEDEYPDKLSRLLPLEEEEETDMLDLEEDIYGPQDPRGHHIDNIAPPEPVIASGVEALTSDDAEEDLINLESEESEEDPEQESERDVLQESDYTRGSLIDTGKPLNEFNPGDYEEGTVAGTVATDQAIIEETQPRGEHIDILTPPERMVQAARDGPVISKRNLLEDVEEDSMDQEDVFDQSSEEGSQEHEGSDAGSYDDPNYQDSVDAEWAQDDPNYQDSVDAEWGQGTDSEEEDDQQDNDGSDNESWDEDNNSGGKRDP